MRTTDYFSTDTEMCGTCILKAFGMVYFINKHKNSRHKIHRFLMVKILYDVVCKGSVTDTDNWI